MSLIYGIHPGRRSVRHRSRSGKTELKIFLPSGLIFPMMVKSTISLTQLKNEIWKFAKNFPLSETLMEPADYVLCSVMMSGEEEELIEETIQLCDVEYFLPIFSVKLQQGNTEERLMTKRINMAAGIGVATGNEKDGRYGNSGEGKKYESDPAMEEMMDFKRNVMNEVCEPAVKKRGESWLTRAQFQYGCELERTADVPECILKLLTSSNSFLVNVMPDPKDKISSTTSLMATITFTVDDLIRDAVRLTMRRKHKVEAIDADIDVDAYVLKITGREELLLGNYPLVQYTYMRRCLSKGFRPDLVMLPKCDIEFYPDLDRIVHPSTTPALPDRAYLGSDDDQMLWSIGKPLVFKVVRAESLDVADDSMVRLHAGIYHGSEPLCAIERSRPKNVKEQSVSWNENVHFSELFVKDIPRSARLAIVIYTIRRTKRNKAKESKVGLQWVNLPLFDYQRRMRSGTVMLRCWPVEGSLYDEVHPIGTTTQNPSETCTVIELEFPKFGKPVVFPSLAKVLEKASQCAKVAGETQDNFMLRTQNKAIASELTATINKDRLYQLEEQNKEILWRFRLNCMDYPNSLPKLLQAVKWSSCDDVAIMLAMLQAWPPIEPENALELLDFTYTDDNVRDFAVKCLEACSDERLLSYLPQLIQVLKYEAYLDCSLGRFLLRRALASRRIANYLFWLVRAEMHTPEATRYSLLLESYCRSCVSHMNELIAQLVAMDHFNTVSMTLQSEKYEKKSTKQLEGPACEFLQADGKEEICRNFLSPLNPSVRLGPLMCDKVKVFDSKKRPLLLRFQNLQEHNNAGVRETRIIFKIGDDLRQDMLTLQLLRLMESFWQQEGYELKMNPYNCLPMGLNIGMIEVVQNSATLSRIQKGTGKTTAAFDKTSLWKWLLDNNTHTDMDRVVENFTVSCAAYCVATFVLGVGDRHNDNIMVTEDGQLFHIDFGHFLGNFKEKLNIKREISPFILDTSFVHVITYGGQKTAELHNFRKLMETLYCILHRHGNLFINLFAMMLSTGIPELKSLEDIRYFRDKLALNKSEDQCRKFFQSQVDLVLASKQQLVSKVNWMIHSMAKD